MLVLLQVVFFSLNVTLAKLYFTTETSNRVGTFVGFVNNVKTTRLKYRFSLLQYNKQTNCEWFSDGWSRRGWLAGRGLTCRFWREWVRETSAPWRRSHRWGRWTTPLAHKGRQTDGLASDNMTSRALPYLLPRLHEARQVLTWPPLYFSSERFELRTVRVKCGQYSTQCLCLLATFKMIT